MISSRTKRVLLILRSYIMFFLLISFVITCCFILFLGTLQANTGLLFTEEDISFAAKITFFNVAFLSLLCTAVDGIRRKITVERPVKRILEATRKITKGDFSARIQPLHIPESMNEFDEIISDFNKMAEELSGIETLKTDFIANVSHELKTPLAVLQNYGEMLCKPNLPEERRLEYAKAIRETTRRFSDLITNILKLNKLDNQQLYPNSESYDLGEQICECLLSFETAIESKNLEVISDIEENIFITLDKELMAIVWNNLFSNAVKFTEANGKIAVCLRQTQTTDKSRTLIEVSVSDTGCGMTAETGKHIFEKFYQGDASHAAQGNGLGLALVKRVVDIIGGEITVESKVGKGSTFTVKIRKYEDKTDQTNNK